MSTRETIGMQVIRKYPIGSFLVINYIISWSFLYPSYQLILQNDGEITPLALIGIIGAYGPTIAALIVNRIVAKGTNKSLLRKAILLKGSWRLYLLIVLGPILFFSMAHILASLNGPNELGFNLVAGLSGVPIWFLAALPFGPMGEELGWRGFMLPRLLEKYSVLKSSVFVGLAWGIWHIASFTFPGAALPEFFPVTGSTIGLYCLNTIALSLMFTYAHLRSKGSVLVAIILHAFFNAASNIVFDFFPETDNQLVLRAGYILNFTLVAIFALILLRRYSVKNVAKVEG